VSADVAGDHLQEVNRDAGCLGFIDSHTDQAIIVGSLIIGLWFIADSLYLIVS